MIFGVHRVSDTENPPCSTRSQIAAGFDQRDVVTSYRYRPQPPPQTFDILEGLIAGEPRVVLDIGCGTGFLARPLAPRVDRLDAVDMSPTMIEEGKRLPGGDDPRLRWMVGRVEDVPLDPPYALVTAGDSLHWMDWEVVLPRLAGALTPSGVLAILDVESKFATADESFRQRLRALLDQFMTMPWRPAGFDLLGELKRRGLFREVGRTETDTVPVRQPVDMVVRSYHARASLGLYRMEPEHAAAFDGALRQLLLDGIGPEIELSVLARITWGMPVKL
jgi:SAM-dependent methyltransferase